MTTETKVKHTPGPWQWSLSGPGPTCKVYHKTIILGEVVLARILASHDEKLMMPSLEVAQANARLIAVAPEQCERLVALLCYLEATEKCTTDDTVSGLDLYDLQAEIYATREIIAKSEPPA